MTDSGMRNSCEIVLDQKGSHAVNWNCCLKYLYSFIVFRVYKNKIEN